jgi:hypothetical protein
VKIAIFTSLAIALSGCISPQEQYKRDVYECEGYGFTEGTDAFANCMMNTAQQRALRWTIIESKPTPTYTPPPVVPCCRVH